MLSELVSDKRPWLLSLYEQTPSLMRNSGPCCSFLDICNSQDAQLTAAISILKLISVPSLYIQFRERGAQREEKRRETLGPEGIKFPVKPYLKSETSLILNIFSIDFSLMGFLSLATGKVLTHLGEGR